MENDITLSNSTKNNSLESCVNENLENINASNCGTPNIQNTPNSAKNDTPKLIEVTVVDGGDITNTPLRPFELSQMLMTSYTPPAAKLKTPVNTPVSTFKRVSVGSTTPKSPATSSAFQTIVQNDPKSHSFCVLKSPAAMTPRQLRNSMHLIDFTTPEIFHTPSTSMNIQRTLLKSALSNTTKKNLSMLSQHDDSVQQSFVSSKQSPSTITPNRGRRTPKKVVKVSPPPSTVIARLEKKQLELARGSPKVGDMNRTQSPAKSTRLSTTPNVKKLTPLITSTPFVRCEREKGRIIENLNALNASETQGNSGMFIAFVRGFRLIYAWIWEFPRRYFKIMYIILQLLETFDM